jgi:integrase
MFWDECELEDENPAFPLWCTETRGYRYQRGSLFQRSRSWYVRYSDGGRQLSYRLGRDITKSEARRRADEFIRPLNERGNNPASMTLEAFVETVYLPAAASQHRASTFDGYEGIWKRYLKPKAQIGLQSFRTTDGERIMQGIAASRQLTGTTLAHVKAFLSGVFTYAARLGHIQSNPMRGVAIPKAGSPRETKAYSLAEVQHLLESLPEPVATIVAVAAFTGLRKGEILGLRWEDYGGCDIKVTRACWRGTVDEPKTHKSKAPVPVVPQLRERLEQHRISQICYIAGFPVRGGMEMRGPIFPGANLDSIARKYDIQWHAFRRGLATVLRQLGIPDTVIQRVLRHSNVSVTQRCYIKTSDDDVKAAMDKLASVSDRT